MMRFFSLLMCLPVLLSMPRAQAQETVSIQLSGVPEQLVLPLPRARNLVLTATVQGGKVKHVWLARSGDDARFELSPAGLHRYQINLRDPALQRALTAPGEQSSFRVFASLPGKRQASSLPVYYEIRSRPAPPAPQVTLLTPKGRKASSGWSCNRWMDPAQLTAIHLEPKRQNQVARAQAGTTSRDFRKAGKELVLELDTPLRRAWQANRELKVFHGHKDQGPAGHRLCTLRAAPKRLDWPGNVVRLRIRQRRSNDVPGSSGYWRISLGDITGGQVRLEFKAANSETQESLSVKPGDELVVRLSQAKYTLRLDRLINQLIGDDHAEFVLFEMPRAERAKVEASLNKVARSGLTFLDGQDELLASQMAARIRRLFEDKGPKVADHQAFLKTFCERSARSDKPLSVVLKRGKTQPLTDWLRSAN